MITLVLKNLLFTIVGPGVVSFAIPLLLFSRQPPDSPVHLYLGGLVISIGSLIYLWCVWNFISGGRGTPAPIDPPKELVTAGLYQYSRNPMYIGVVLIICGWSLLFRSLPIAIYGTCVFAAFHLRVLFYEEPHLRDLFGREYSEYCGRVNRWITIKPRAVS